MGDEKPKDIKAIQDFVETWEIMKLHRAGHIDEGHRTPSSKATLAEDPRVKEQDKIISQLYQQDQIEVSLGM